ncbi:unnamed protein product [Spirodela intermedia]|uniref:Uncharacterized protein n=1 Tax=Spirodela intermedia TaxID=51605 RepID=A0A7I8JBZ4_SPIIN|nr:unnamed protein product [Spirodela intermedia]CAA6667629.1 unnamed protein product [Spirodela intermedia]
MGYEDLRPTCIGTCCPVSPTSRPPPPPNNGRHRYLPPAEKAVTVTERWKGRAGGQLERSRGGSRRRGDIDGAIAVLESIVARLGGSDASSLAPVTVVAIPLEWPWLPLATWPVSTILGDSEQQLKGTIPERKDSRVSGGACDDDDDDDVDDWEAVADRPLPDIVGVSSSQETENVRSESTTKRRGRGHFLYKKDGLYSDQLNESGSADRSDSDEELDRHSPDMPPGMFLFCTTSQSTRTTDLEKIFEAFREDGFAIRWVNDTCALAVFRTPSFASRALSTSPCPFKVRMIEDNSDKILTQISAKDLEPPHPRPKTSARTAQRLIAQGMGLKLTGNFGSRELRIQEAARRDRIHARHGLRDDAWGPEDP